MYYRNKVNSGQVAQYVKKRNQRIVNTKISILLYSLSHQKEILDEKRKRDELRKKRIEKVLKTLLQTKRRGHSKNLPR